MMSAYFYFQPIDIDIRLVLLEICKGWGQTDPPPLLKNTTLKKPRLITIKTDFYLYKGVLKCTVKKYFVMFSQLLIISKSYLH